MSHRPDLHDLVDGRLTPAAAEEVLGHVAGCAECAAELTDLRRARAALTSPIPIAPPELTARLLALGVPAPPARPAGPSAPLPGAEVTLSDTLHPRRRLLPLAAVAASAVVLALAVLGEPRTVVPTDHRAEALAVLAVRSGTAVTSDPLAGTLPAGYGVLDVVEDAAGTMILVTTPAGVTVVVERAPGRLAEVTVATHPVVEVGGHPVVLLSREPFHAVWQCGDEVMGVVGPDRASVADLVAALPHVDYDAGAVARVVRGWQVLAGTWSP